MKFHIEAEPDELKEKSGDLLKAVAEKLAPHSEEATALLKALQKGALDDQRQLVQFPVMKEIHKRSMKIYKRQMSRMLDEIHAIVRDGS